MDKKLFVVIPPVSPHISSGSTIQHNKDAAGIVYIEYILGFYDNFDYSSIVTPEIAEHLPEDAIKLYLNFHYFMNDDIKIMFDEKDSVIEKINADKNSYLWIFSPHEIMKSQNVAELLQQSGIDLKKVIYTNSNFEMNNTVVDEVKYVSCPEWWEAQYRYNLTAFKNIPFIGPSDKHKTLATASKKMLSLNRNIKSHRPWWYNELLDSKLLTESYVSYHVPDIAKQEGWDNTRITKWIRQSIGSLYNYYTDDGIKYPTTIDNRLLVSQPLDGLFDFYVINYQSSIKDYYHDSLFSIITESFYDHMFLTEKTFKAITHCHPFIIIGDTSMNDELNRRGYKTYDDMFGAKSLIPFVNSKEMIAYLERLTINKLRDLVYKNWELVEYNWNHFFNRKISWNTVKNNIMKVII